MKWWGISLFLFLTAFPAQASFSFSLESANPNSINSLEQEVGVKLNIIDLPSESYFRVGWKKEGSSAYFGYVKNQDNNWTKIETLNSDCKNYYKVSDTGTTTLTLLTKMGSDSTHEAGNYLLKAHRFTSSCASNSGSENEQMVVLNIPTPTPTPIPTPTPTATPTPTPSSTPKPTPSSTPKPTQTPTPKPTSVPSSTIKPQVLASSFQPLASASPTPSPSPEILSSKTSVPSYNWLAGVAVILGGGVFSFSIWHIIKGYVHPPLS